LRIKFGTNQSSKISRRNEKKVLVILMALFCKVGIIGCGGYNKVKDPTTGQIYFTNDLKEEKGGAVRFEDYKTKTNVTLQNSQIKKMSKKEFNSALESEGAPESKPVKE